MTINIFNTKSGQKVPLTPLEEGHVRMYVCGITAYDYCHIGHARSALIFDMIVKYLRWRGYRVTYVRNFTDIDDKIINRAAEQRTSCKELAERFILAFQEDMANLGVASADIEPRATEFIPEIIEMIKDLESRGLAYSVDGDVYFRVDNFHSYGQLSGREAGDLLAGARVAVNENKRNPMDFALWKASKPGEPTWESPWGPGRPGWHIECSAMGRKLLGDTFDIHGGGKDLVFPHHENEIAQSEGATGAPFVNIWIHHGFVTIREEKMSKSLGNFLTIRDVLSRFDAETLRLFVFSTHYRNPLDFSESAVEDAEVGLERLYGCLAEIDQLPSAATGGKSIVSEEDREKVASVKDRFSEVMDNDFNTAQGLAVLFDTAKLLNRIRQAFPKKASVDDIELLRQGAGLMRDLAGIMGLLGQDPVKYLRGKAVKLLTVVGMTEEEVERLIRERAEARLRKDWDRADAIRRELLEKRIELKDGGDGTTWTMASR